MAKLSPEERQQMEALMMRDQEPEEVEDWEVVIEENGRRVTMPYSKAKTLLNRWGFDLDDIAPEGAGDADPNADPNADPDADPDLDADLGGDGAGQTPPARLGSAQRHFRRTG